MTIVDKELVGEGTSITNEFPNVPLGIFLEKSFQKNIDHHGDAKWLTDVSTRKSMNYSQMVSSMRSIASGLRKRGFQTGDNVVVIGLNFIEIPLMSMGAWRAGGSQACLSVNLPADTIEMRMRELGNKFVLTDFDRASRIVEVVKRLDFVKEVFVIGDVPVSGCNFFDQLLEDSGDECPDNLDDVDLDSMAWLAYTSGTTGIPKGIVMTHQTVVAAFTHWKCLAYNNGHKFLFVNLMNITAGILVAMGLSLGHADLYCLSEFSEKNLLSAIDRIKPSSVSLLPVHIAWICRYPQLDEFDLSSVRSVTVMGSSLNTFYEHEIFNKLPNMLFLSNIYGMTEAGMACRIRSVAPSEWEKLDKSKVIASRVFGTAGTMEPNCKLKVVNPETGEKFGPNQTGEICLQTPFMLKEYLNKPQETANLIRDGWIHTGDQGYYDENENVFIVGRYKELIKYRNTHVVPTNVEKHIMTHPAVEDVAVVGLPDEIDGERPMAFIVLSLGYNVTDNDLITFTNEGVTEEEKLRGGIRFVGSIPRNGLGKIIRTELKKQLM